MEGGIFSAMKEAISIDIVNLFCILRHQYRLPESALNILAETITTLEASSKRAMQGLYLRSFREVGPDGERVKNHFLSRLSTDFRFLSQPNLSSPYLRRKHLKGLNGDLEAAFKPFWPNEGQDHHFYSIFSLKALVKRLLSDELLGQMWSTWERRYQDYQRINTSYEDSGTPERKRITSVYDGTRYQRLAGNESNVIPIVIYTDGFTVNSQIGSKSTRHRLTAFYVGTPLAPNTMSQTKCLHLLALAFTDDLKLQRTFPPAGTTTGLSVILNDLVDGVMTMEDDTFTINGRHVKARLLSLNADHLDAQKLAGMASSFGPNMAYTCRQCMISNDDMHKVSSYADMQSKSHERTQDSFRENAARFERDQDPRASKGVRSLSPLARLPYLDLGKDIINDLNHNLHGGCYPFHHAFYLLIQDM